MFECLRGSKAGILIDIHVVPNSKNESISYDKWEKRIKVKVKEQPEDGKANKSVIKKFSDLFGNCGIVNGNLSRKKTILVKNRKIRDINQILENIVTL